MTIRKFITLFVLAICCACSISPACAQAPATGEQMRGDRIQLLQQFLATFYPDLKYTEAMLYAHWQHREVRGVSFQIIIRNCDRGSGPIAPSIPPPPPPLLPYCGALPKPSEKVLNAAWFTTDGIHINDFQPHGGMLTERLDAVIGEIDRKINNGAHEYPEGLNLRQEQEAIKILNAAEPAYGPKKRDEFLKFMPVENFYRFTGCRLEPATAEFRIQSADTPILQWFVVGRSEDRKESCMASFEPFAGYVTGFQYW